jgi:hypothetical protein
VLAQLDTDITNRRTDGFNLKAKLARPPRFEKSPFSSTSRVTSCGRAGLSGERTGCESIDVA